MAFESFKGFSENQIEQPRGTDVGFTDYLIDVPVGAVKGLSQAVQGLLSSQVILFLDSLEQRKKLPVSIHGSTVNLKYHLCSLKKNESLLSNS